MMTTDEEIQCLRDIEHMQAGNCDIDFIAETLQQPPGEIRRLIKHREEMARNMTQQTAEHNTAGQVRA